MQYTDIQRQPGILRNNLSSNPGPAAAAGRHLDKDIKNL